MKELFIPYNTTHVWLKRKSVTFFRCVDYDMGTYDFWNGVCWYTRRELPPKDLIPLTLDERWFK